MPSPSPNKTHRIMADKRYSMTLECLKAIADDIKALQKQISALPTTANRLYLQVVDNDMCEILPEKSDFTNIEELRDQLEKMWDGGVTCSLAITVEKAGIYNVFIMSGLYKQGSNFRIQGRVATDAESFAEANILVKQESMSYYQYDSLAQTSISTVKNKLSNYPDITQEMLTSGKGYVFCEGRFDDVFPADSTPLYEPGATAASLALESIRQKVLILPDDIDDKEREKLIEEIRLAIGDDNIFNELAANAAATLEITPDIPVEEQIRQAKEEYIRQKEEAQLADASEITGENSSDVEPLNTDKI